MTTPATAVLIGVRRWPVVRRLRRWPGRLGWPCRTTLTIGRLLGVEVPTDPWSDGYPSEDGRNRPAQHGGGSDVKELLICVGLATAITAVILLIVVAYFALATLA